MVRFPISTRARSASERPGRPTGRARDRTGRRADPGGPRWARGHELHTVCSTTPAMPPPAIKPC
eukprot:6412787-Lingulodinium_polyedra.AAC.1